MTETQSLVDMKKQVLDYANSVSKYIFAHYSIYLPNVSLDTISATLIQLAMGIRVAEVKMSDEESLDAAIQLLDSLDQTDWMAAVNLNVPKGEHKLDDISNVTYDDYQKHARVIIEIVNNRYKEGTHVFNMTMALLLIAYTLYIHSNGERETYSKNSASYGQLKKYIENIYKKDTNKSE